MKIYVYYIYDSTLYDVGIVIIAQITFIVKYIIYLITDVNVKRVNFI